MFSSCNTGFIETKTLDVQIRHRNVWQHLRSFRKRLFDAIPDEALRLDGAYVDLAADWAFMLPIVEMAEKPSYIFESLYLYEPSGMGKDPAGRTAARRPSRISSPRVRPRRRRIDTGWRPTDEPGREEERRRDHRVGQHAFDGLQHGGRDRRLGNAVPARRRIRGAVQSGIPSRGSPRAVIACARGTRPESWRDGAPVDTMDKPPRAPPTCPRARRRRRKKRFEEIPAARTTTGRHLDRTARPSE